MIILVSFQTCAFPQSARVNSGINVCRLYYIHPVTNLLRMFYHKKFIEIYQMSFPHHSDALKISTIHRLMQYFMLIGLYMLTHLCSPMMSLTWSWWRVISGGCWIQCTLLRTLTYIYIHKGHWTIIFYMFHWLFLILRHYSIDLGDMSLSRTYSDQARWHTPGTLAPRMQR